MSWLLDHLPAINFFLNMGTIAGLAALTFTFRRRREFWVGELHRLVEEMKRELPPIIVGEIMTRWDMERVDRRLERLENITGWLESLQGQPSNVPPIE